MPLEPAEQKRALELLADTAGNDGDEREHRGVGGGARQLFERVLRHVVQPRHEEAQQVQQDHHADEHDRHQHEPDCDFDPHAPLAEPEFRRAFPVHPRERHHQRHEHERVGEREREYEWQEQVAAGILCRPPGQSQHAADQYLCRHARAQQDFANSHQPFVRGFLDDRRVGSRVMRVKHSEWMRFDRAAVLDRVKTTE
jgi:hypothetical protein